ncbi:ATP-binding cassette domain-containing protein [Rathayibacter soli]|uniref:ATP-binding cassette domain-containing protein n=1 Tax=Rathayibacter soli TaxID=3144168 RepID=UPI0027E465BF|nr:ATP-binding cassette domain-containing protein [Glaciibacter superstes]
MARIRLPDPAPSGRLPLSTVGLAKAYGDRTVLKDLNRAVDRGARIAVLGANGAGKTTPLKLLAGLAYSGANVLLLDEPTNNLELVSLP